VAIAGNIVGPLIILTVIVSVIFNRRQARDDSDLQVMIAAIRREGNKLDHQLEQNFDVSTSEVTVRLRQLHSSMINVELLDSIDDWRKQQPEDFT
jgi:hypothetical protein